MLLRFPCPHCNTEMELDATRSNASIQCPACSEDISPPAATVQPGVTLGNFLIEQRLGGGAMGDVFLALQLSMDRHVALKVLPQALTRDERVVERFRREVRMSARLEHPNIVTAFEAGEDFGYHFLAMSYVDGEDLGTRRKREGALLEKDALRAGRQVAEALRYAWEEHKLLHRDVKPSNIMMDGNNRARLMDLGISICLTEAQASLTTAGMVVGTPHYMSPEQIRGEDLDWRADAYSLGATLYHLVTGGPPFKGTGSAEVISRHLTEQVVPARKRRASVSVGCSDLLERMMAKSREERHRTWDDLLRDFDLVMGGKRPPIAPGKATKSHEIPAAKTAGQATSATLAGTGAAVPPPVAATEEPPGTGEERLPPVIKFKPRRSGAGGIRKALTTLIVLALLAALGVALWHVWRQLQGQRSPKPQESQPTVAAPPVTPVAAPETDTRRPTEPEELRDLLDKVANALLNKRPSDASTWIAQAAKDPSIDSSIKPALDRLETLLGQFRGHMKALRHTFEQDVGKQVTILLNSGKRTVTIEQVMAGAVLVRERKADGTTQRSRIAFRDMSTPERIRRMERMPNKTITLHLLIGLLYAENGEYSQAKRHFQQGPTLLAPALDRALDKLIASPNSLGTTPSSQPRTKRKRLPRTRQ